MSPRENLQETDNKEKYYEHFTYPNIGDEGMSPLINQYTALMPQLQNIYLYGTPGHFGPESQYNSPTHSDNPFIHERLFGNYNLPNYYISCNCPYYHNSFYGAYYSNPIFLSPYVFNMPLRYQGWYCPY